ncbi:hypothetical protein [Pedobacter sp. MW01-1-1]
MKIKYPVVSFLFILSFYASAQQADISGIDKDTITTYSKFKHLYN